MPQSIADECFVDTTEPSLSGVSGQLISGHYLTHQLVDRADWKALPGDTRIAKIEQLFERVKPRLAKNQPSSKGSNERCAISCSTRRLIFWVCLGPRA